MHALLFDGPKVASGAVFAAGCVEHLVHEHRCLRTVVLDLDHGGPARRGLETERAADFLFPQISAGGAEGVEQWTPGFIDYLYVSFTNATAFSPTDTMPLSVRSELLVMVEAGASLLTVGLVAARAANVLA